MNIFVCIKQLPDTETKVIPTNDKSFIETANVKWIMNPYDEFAVEQALLIKGEQTDTQVIVLRVGSVKDSEALRTALAMGADEAFLVETNDFLDSYMTAKAIKGAIEKSAKTPDLILCGKQAIDDDCLQVPQILAQMMNFPSVSVVVGFEQTAEKIQVRREIEGGSLEVYELNLPAVIACNKGLNTPRYPSLPGIMKAKKKPLTTYSLSDVGVSENDRKVKYTEFVLPQEKPAGKKFDAREAEKQADIVKEVVNLLRTEAKII
ncbi:MAG: electron transfer flavoprotein subunit beta/FixA family protein [Bacteriovoracaceae bacterium]|nr:electron transfer flavoprotein subunit beta/FixA family protein [Bacteriovoracaceae bacterium]